MASPLPPDPYLALNVPRDAPADTIKKQYRKLILKFHPDKVQDETQKQIASDQFHKVQTAFEIIGDEDRRHRYDAQMRLAELRKDMMEKGGSQVGGKRPAENKQNDHRPRAESPREPRDNGYFTRGSDRTERAPPQYEERRPSYAAQAEHFDEAPRATSRKYASEERPSKRAPPRPEPPRERPRMFTRESSYATKEKERDRREKSKRTDKDLRRDRATKHQPARPMMETDSSSSDSDPYERTRKQHREEDEQRRAREQYWEQVRRQQAEAANDYYPDERARKIFSQGNDAREYIRSGGRPERRAEPEPVRPALARGQTRDKVENVKRGEGPPVMMRRSSTRPKTTTRDSESPRRAAAPRERDPRSSDETVDEHRDMRRPPGLQKNVSSPAGMHLPTFDKQRSQSVQMDRDDFKPQMKRAETMPQQATNPAQDPRRKDRSTAPERGSRLRRTETTAARNSPAPSPERPQASRKYSYAPQQPYAEDREREREREREYAAQDAYRTEIREPTRGKHMTRSPSPMKDRAHSHSRPTTKSYAPQAAPPRLPRTTSHRYDYSSAAPTTAGASANISPTAGPGAGPSPTDAYPSTRPPMARADSSCNTTATAPVAAAQSQQGPLYGEVPTTAGAASMAAPPPMPSGTQQTSRPPKGAAYESMGKGSSGAKYASTPREERSGGGGGFFGSSSKRRGSYVRERPGYGRSGSGFVSVR